MHTKPSFSLAIIMRYHRTLNHLMNCTDVELVVRAIFMKFASRSFEDIDVNFQITENRKLVTFLDEILAAFTLGITSFDNVADWCNVTISRSHIIYFP